MSTITDLVALILDATRGDQVRDSIADALLLCYQDGKAGSIDLQARGLANTAMVQNEEQEAQIQSILAIIEEMQGGGGDEQITGQTSTDVPTVILDYGYENFNNVDYNVSTRHNITFNKTFTEPPIVFAMIAFRNGANANYANVVTGPINSTITTTGFELTVGNKNTVSVSPIVLWVAFQPTVVTIDTEIIVPPTDDLTEAQIQSLIGLLE